MLRFRKTSGLKVLGRWGVFKGINLVEVTSSYKEKRTTNKVLELSNVRKLE